MKVTTAPVNVAIQLRAMADHRPEAAAVICVRTRDRDGNPVYESLTFRELDRESNRYAHGLGRIGVTRGTRTVLMVRPGLEFFALTFALFKIGAVIVMIDPGMGRKNMGACLAEAEPEAFIGIPLAHAGRVLMRWGRRTIKTNVTVGPRLFWGGHTHRELREGTSPEFECAETGSDEIAAILFTSGSTGVPKGAVYTHGVFAAQVDYLRNQFDIEPGEVDLATFPLFALFDAALGMTAVIPEMDASKPAAADPRKLVEAITDHGVTQMFGSPALVERLARYAQTENIRLDSIKRVLSAGAPVRPDILERLASVIHDDAQIYTPYGATEALPVANIESREILGETRDETIRGGGNCVGRPVPEIEVSIIRIDDGAIEEWSPELLAVPGEIGEIVVKGPIVTRAYYNRPDLTALAKIKSPIGDEIYHRMGDVGRIDESGRLWFCGRKSHRVIMKDGTLFTIPCEGVFNQHPAVFRTALVGVGPRSSRRPILCVELEKENPGSDRATIERDLLQLASPHAHTRDIQTILFHPAFPVDHRHNAKIDRERLSLWAEEQLK